VSTRESGELQIEYLRTDELRALRQSMSLIEEGLNSSTPSAAERGIYMSQRCNGARMLYEALGDWRYLEVAVDAGRACLAGPKVRPAAQAQRLSNLGYALRLRYEVRGEVSDIDEAVGRAEAALASLGPEDPSRGRYLSNLAVALRVRHEVSGLTGDLDRAVEIGAAAIRATETEDEHYIGMVHNLALAHLDLVEAGGGKTHLHEAVRLLRLALADTARDRRDWDMGAVNLSSALRLAAGEEGDRTLADEAVELAGQALQRIPEGHPDQAEALSQLGRIHRVRSDLSHDHADVRRSIDFHRQAAMYVPGNVPLRTRSALAWAGQSREDGDVTGALAGYRAAVELIARAAWRGLDNSSRERQIRSAPSLGQDAAATALECVDPDAAIALVEEGRTLFRNRQLEQRTDLRELEHRRQDLAVRLKDVAQALDALSRRFTPAT
jgi:hypothetical protein